jgi:hypothetical protein
MGPPVSRRRAAQTRAPTAALREPNRIDSARHSLIRAAEPATACRRAFLWWRTHADKNEPAWINDPRSAHLEGIQDWLSVTAMAAASAETVASTEAAAKAVATEARVSAKTTARCEAPRDAAAEARRSGAHGHHARGGRHHP